MSVTATGDLFTAENCATHATIPFIKVAVPKPLRTLFDYAVPEQCATPPLGARVRVPFGRGHAIGICIAHSQRSEHAQPKPLLEVLDPDIGALNDELLALAGWLASYYHHPIGEVCQALLPAAARRGQPLKLASEAVWQLLPGPAPDLRRAPRQAECLALLRAAGGVMTRTALRAAGAASSALNALQKRDLVHAQQRVPATIRPRAGAAPTLTAEQQRALDAVLADRHRFATHLLYGITGSGKTEVYLQAIDAVLSAGRQALVLVPEIALTPQTLARFRERFGVAAALHSQMSDTERLNTWLRCAAGLEPLLIGTRSAVLTPFADLGLIVVDEEHDPSYKQADGLRYSARDLAVKRARNRNIPLLLGSATPSLESLHNVARGRYRESRLTERPGGAQVPPQRVLDLRGVRLEEGLAPELLHVMAAHLDAGNQVLVFINRRGYAPTTLCLSCRWQALCTHCSARLTLHQGRSPHLRCHHCGARSAVPEHCPDCNSSALIPVGAGTQRTEAALSARFPEVPLLRIDRDTTRSARRLQAQLEQVQSGASCLLVGTQMLAKGHHFPAVTLVAILDADGGFLAADYRAPERTAALITQVTGRAGRADRPGEVLIQSLFPDNEVLAALIEGGYDAFARIELANRAAAGLPPYLPAALLRAEGHSSAAADELLRTLTAPVQNAAGLTVLGPAPAPLARLAGRFRSQILLTAAQRAILHGALRQVVNAAPPSRHGQLSWSVDVDPYDTY